MTLTMKGLDHRLSRVEQLQRRAIRTALMLAAAAVVAIVVFFANASAERGRICDSIREYAHVEVDALARQFGVDPQGPEASAYRNDLLDALKECD